MSRFFIQFAALFCLASCVGSRTSDQVLPRDLPKFMSENEITCARFAEAINHYVDMSEEKAIVALKAVAISKSGGKMAGENLHDPAAFRSLLLAERFLVANPKDWTNSRHGVVAAKLPEAKRESDEQSALGCPVAEFRIALVALDRRPVNLKRDRHRFWCRPAGRATAAGKRVRAPEKLRQEHQRQPRARAMGTVSSRVGPVFADRVPSSLCR